MNGAESVSGGFCKFCGKECLTEYEGKHFEYCPRCRTEKQRLERTLADLINLLNQSSIFPMLDATEQLTVRLAERALDDDV